MLYIILGPTCSGKNALARHLAPQLNAEIISVDSMKIYGGMDIGTAKAKRSPERASPAINGINSVPSNDGTNQPKVTYHLIDIIAPDEPYNAARFLQDAEDAIAKIQAKGRMPLLAVGTPMYLKVLLYGMFTGPSRDANIRKELEELARTKGPEFLHNKLKSVDPVKADQLHPNDLKRIIRALEVHQLTGQPISSMQTHFKKEALRYPARIVGLEHNRAELYQRINDRVDRMFKAGLVDEVKGLLKKYGALSAQVEPSDIPHLCGTAQAVGYKEVIAHLDGKMTLPEAIDTVKKNTRHFARRQISWFHKFPDVKWITVSGNDTPETLAKEIKKDWLK
jgi:tRNA dimethylallyltransferase